MIELSGANQENKPLSINKNTVKIRIIIAIAVIAIVSPFLGALYYFIGNNAYWIAITITISIMMGFEEDCENGDFIIGTIFVGMCGAMFYFGPVLVAFIENCWYIPVVIWSTVGFLYIFVLGIGGP